MRYRNLIIGSIIGAIIGAVFVALFGAFGVGIPIPTLAFVTLAFALFFAFFGGMVGAFVGVIDDSELTLVVEYRHYKPGDKVDVQVSLHPQKSFSLRGGKVELVCLETLYVSSDEGGLTKRTHERWRSALPFLNEQQIVEGRPYIETFNFSIPNDALPSLQPVGVYWDPCADISWRVQASLDIAGAQDIHQTRGLYVYLPLVPDSSPPLPMENISRFRPKRNFPGQHFDQCVVSLSVSAMACAGETLDGRFSIQVRQDFKVRGVWVELECWERAGAKTARTIRDSVSLLGRERLTASQVLEWPFQMQVPNNSLPSTALQDTQVVWRARGMLDVGRIMQRNLEVQQQIQVYIDPFTFSLPSSSGAAVPSLGQQCLWCGHRYRQHIDTSLDPSLGREPNGCSVVYCPCQEFKVEE